MPDFEFCELLKFNYKQYEPKLT